MGHGGGKLQARQKQEIGPAPLFLKCDEEFQTCDAYAMTAMVHDLLIDEVRGNTAYPVQQIYPGGREFIAYYVCIHETETQEETQINKHELKARPLRQAIEIVKKNLCAVGLLTPKRVGGADSGDTGDDQSARDALENGTEEHKKPARMKREEAAERLERLREQGEKYTSQGRLAKQIGCAQATISKAIHSNSSLAAWAKAEPVPKVQSASAIVIDQAAQYRELFPDDDAAIREFIEAADPETKAWFLSLRPTEQLAHLNDPDANLYASDPETGGKGRLHPRILNHKT